MTDSTGYYRLISLPPGTATLNAELTGFATYRREGILMRAGSTFSVDIEMKVGGLNETVSVMADSSMIETVKASTSFAVSGEMLRSTPVTSQIPYLTSQVGSADFKPTNQQREVQQLFAEQVKAHQGQLDALRARDLAAFAELVRTRNHAK